MMHNQRVERTDMIGRGASERRAPAAHDGRYPYMSDYRALAECISEFSRGLESTHRAEDRGLADQYLAHLAPVLARLCLGQRVLDEIADVERLFGLTWIVDVEPFRRAFQLWGEFRDSYQRSILGGMTVNERLVAMHLAEEFDAARRNDNTQEMRRILEAVYLDQRSVARVISRGGEDG